MKQSIFIASLAILFAGCETMTVTEWTPQESRALERVVQAPFEKMVENARPVGLEVGRIYFEYDKSELTDEVKRDLERIAYELNRRQGTVVIEGHADHNNTDEYNMRLGYQRALAAAGYLRSAGVWEERMHIRSYGESRPSASNWSDGTRALNRAVVVKTFAQGDPMTGNESQRAYEEMMKREKDTQPAPSLMLQQMAPDS